MSYLGSLGQYELERKLAHGGMAEIFVAHREGLVGSPAKVAIKRIRRDRAQDAAHVELFLNEARIAAHFDHPNLVPVRELIQDHGQLAMVMELIDGHSVRELLQRCRTYGRQVPLEIAAYIVAEAAEGLHYAHELRDEAGDPLHVVHRDVSPGNVLVTRDGGVRLLDFGVAASDLPSGDDEADAARDRFSYLAPEAILNQPLDRRADVFGLGIVYYELLTLQPCFTRAEPIDTLDAIIHSRYQPVHRWRESVPSEPVAMLQRMLERRPEHRYPTAAEVSIRLWQHLVEHQPAPADGIRDFFADLFYELPPIERSAHERDTLEIDADWLLDYASAVDDDPGDLVGPQAEEETLIELTEGDLLPNTRGTGVADVLAALDLPTATPWSAEPNDDDAWSVTPTRPLEIPEPPPAEDDEVWWVHEGHRCFRPYLGDDER